MFNVKLKGDINNKKISVFAVNNNCDNDTQFLIYENNKWEWVPSCMFEPVFIKIEYVVKSYTPLIAEMSIEADKIISEKMNKEGENNA